VAPLQKTFNLQKTIDLETNTTNTETKKPEEKKEEKPKISEEFSWAELPSFSDESDLIFMRDEEAFKGHIRIEGWHIVEAELVVKSQKWNKAVPFKTQIHPHTPLKLVQIHNAFNYLKLALSSVYELELAIRSSDCELLAMISKKISESLQFAMQELINQSKNVFPKETLNSTLVFQPPLPPDLVIEFTLKEKKLIATVHCLHAISYTPPKPNEKTEIQLNTSPVGLIHQYKRHGTTYWVEVVDFVESLCPTNNFNEIYALIDTTYKLLADFRDKIVVFV